MSDSTTWLDTIATNQSQKETTANELFDASSLGSLFGRHASTSAALTWGYYGGRLWDGTNAVLIANGTLALAASATNYIEATTAGVVSSNTSAFTVGRIRIAKAVTSGSSVASYEDHRTVFMTGGSTGGGSVGTVTSVNLTAPAEGITASGGPVTSSGSITLALANDLAAVEALSATGIVRRTGTSAWSAGTAVNLTSEVTGVLPVANYATGTPTGSKFVRDDGVLAVPAGSTSGTVTHTAGALTSNAVVLGAGTDDVKVVAGVTSDGTSKLNLGVAGASVGAVVLANATSGSITVQPPTGALGSVTVTVPAATDTLANLAGSQALTNKTYNGNTWTAGTLTLTGASGKTFTVNNTLTLAGTDGTTMTFPPASASVGYLNVPQNSQSTAYTTVLADSGKHLLHPSADTTARTFTIDSNANVAYPIGTAITFVNQASAGVMTIAITTDTMRLAGAGTTGSRTLAANGIATALKVTSTEWIISGTGLT